MAPLSAARRALGALLDGELGTGSAKGGGGVREKEEVESETERAIEPPLPNTLQRLLLSLPLADERVQAASAARLSEEWACRETITALASSIRSRCSLSLQIIKHRLIPWSAIALFSHSNS
jgi:hypothetical protein